MWVLPAARGALHGNIIDVWTAANVLNFGVRAPNGVHIYTHTHTDLRHVS